MLYVKAIDGAIVAYPYSPTDLIRENPSTSFPVGGISTADLAVWNVFPVHFSAPPSIDSLTQKIVESPPLYDGLSWVQQWAVEALSQEEIDANTAQQASSVRAERDRLLTATDWIAIKAMETGALAEYSAVIEYRQALRDIPSQAGFPQDILWPSMGA